ncbi:MAG: hypothetical protein RR387_07085 [Clostridiales bacterium]
MPLCEIKILQEELKTIVICVDSYANQLISGRIYHNMLNRKIHFANLMQLVQNIQLLLDGMDFPRDSTEKRSFGQQTREDIELTATADTPDHQIQPGTMATFKIRVLFRQNASWQGMITWLEGRCDDSFRSALEMILMMDSALSK